MNLQKTAILIFAQSAQKEAVSKPFKNAAKVFTQLNKHTVTTVKNSKLPYFHTTEEAQVGATFGERLTNAIQSVYDQEKTMSPSQIGTVGDVKATGIISFPQ